MKTINPKEIREVQGNKIIISKEEYEQFKRMKQVKEALDKENREYQRERSIKWRELQIKQAQREVDFKKKQLKEGIVETLSRQDKESGLNTGFKDGLKPDWYLQNEIERLEFDIEDFNFQIKEIKKAQEEDDKDVS